MVARLIAFRASYAPRARPARRRSTAEVSIARRQRRGRLTRRRTAPAGATENAKRQPAGSLPSGIFSPNKATSAGRHQQFRDDSPPGECRTAAPSPIADPRPVRSWQSRHYKDRTTLATTASQPCRSARHVGLFLPGCDRSSLCPNAADCEDVATTRGRPLPRRQRHVPGVERAHRRHQRNALADAAPLADQFAQGDGFTNNLHANRASDTPATRGEPPRRAGVV